MPAKNQQQDDDLRLIEGLTITQRRAQTYVRMGVKGLEAVHREHRRDLDRALDAIRTATQVARRAMQHMDAIDAALASRQRRAMKRALKK